MAALATGKVQPTLRMCSGGCKPTNHFAALDHEPQEAHQREDDALPAPLTQESDNDLYAATA